MNKIIGRIINEYNNKKENIFIIHNADDKKYRLIVSKEKIDTSNLLIGDIIEFTGTLVSEGKYSNLYNEYICNNISLLKKNLLRLNESAINESNKYKAHKERQFFHTKMILDESCIKQLKIYNIVTRNIRNYLELKKFVECRTPIITNSFHGGGAFPLETYVNYKHKKCYLRANSILPLSMYLAGGLNRVFEIGEYFRNGSVTSMHSVPYLAAEIYSTDINYKEILAMAKEIFVNIVTNVNNEYNYDNSIEVEIVNFEQFMKKNEYSEFSISNLEDYFQFKKIKYSENKYENINNLYRIFKEKIVPKYKSNLIIKELPAGISPFIDCLYENSDLLKRALFFFKGYTIMEIAYSSNDSKKILDSIKNQTQVLEKLNERNIDKSCVGYEHALKLGILPMSSITISVERFISLICNNKNITDYLIDV